MQVFLVLFSFCFIFSSAYESSDLRCLVCKATAKEMENIVSQESSSRTVNIGGYQIDGSGNTKPKKKLLVQSEMYLTEVMEKVCEKMADYIRATRKDNGKLVLLSISDLTSTSAFGEVDIIQDGDLNRSLEFLCKGIVEEFDDDFLEVFGRSSKTPGKDICVDQAGLCDEESYKDEL